MQQVYTATTSVNRDEAIEQLKSFCRGEISAVETYRQAIEITPEPWIAEQLRNNMLSHEERVRLLCLRIAELGGDPPESSGVWGTFVKAVEGAATALGEKPALSMLEEGEDHGLKDYRADLARLDDESCDLVCDRILPAQEHTYAALTRIKQQLS